MLKIIVYIVFILYPEALVYIRKGIFVLHINVAITSLYLRDRDVTGCVSLLRITIQTNTIVVIRLQVIYELRTFTRHKQE